MTVRLIFLYGLAILFIIALFSNPATAQSASIRATATVIKPIGINCDKTDYGSDSTDTRVSICKPENSAVLCCIEADGILIDEFTIQDQNDISLTAEMINAEIRKSETDTDEIVITLIYSEN